MSTNLNVLRYSFLGAGVVWGFMHQRTISRATRQQEAQAELEHNERIYAKAKAAWLKKQMPDSNKEGDGVISNPDDPKFDLEKYLMKIEADDQAAKAKA